MVGVRRGVLGKGAEDQKKEKIKIGEIREKWLRVTNAIPRCLR